MVVARVPTLFFFILVIISFGENTLGDGTPEDWTRLRELALDIANNGQKEGESCETRPSNYAALKISLFGYDDNAAMAEGYTLADIEKILTPDKKYISCAAKLNLICSEIHNQCKSCKDESISLNDVELCGQRVRDIVEKLK